MLHKIMTTDPNFDLLRETGVSLAAIDFVRWLLNRDPVRRPSEEECLCHPWIANVTDVDEYEQDDFLDGRTGLADIGEGEEEDPVEYGLDASQLSLYDDEADEGQGWAEQVKRRRFDCPEVLPYPVVAESNERSLFGEVGASSAQHSSGIFPVSDVALPYAGRRRST